MSDASIPTEWRNLADDYLADRLDADALARLESILRADPAARRFLLSYAGFDRDLAMEVHARRQASAALARIGFDPTATPAATGFRLFRPRPLHGLAAAALLSAALGGWWISNWQKRTAPNTAQTAAAVAPPAVNADVAWLVNAQDCQWSDGSAPPDMKPGTMLKIERGLAQVRFGSGAALLLEGPAKLELLSANGARLHSGRLTGRVAGPIKGFELLVPSGRVIDLGTEFGVAVADSGQTEVRVFDGRVQVAGGDAKVLELQQSQAVNVGRQGVTAVAEPSAFVRQIELPPIITARLALGGFRQRVRRHLVRQNRRRHRVHPSAARHRRRAGPPRRQHGRESANKPAGNHHHRKRHQQASPHAHRRIPGRSIGRPGLHRRRRLRSGTGCTDIPGLKNVGQFGLYAGVKSDCVIRGGLISRATPPTTKAATRFS